MRTLKILVFGDWFGLPLAKQFILRNMSRTFSSLGMLLPKISSWIRKDVLINSTDKEYGLCNFESHCADIGYQNGKDFITYAHDDNITLNQHPGVEFHCWFSKGDPMDIKWKGPFTIKERVGRLDYLIAINSK